MGIAFGFQSGNALTQDLHILNPRDKLRPYPFGKLKARPRDGKPVTTWSNRDEAFLDVAKGIRRVVEELTKNPQ